MDNPQSSRDFFEVSKPTCSQETAQKAVSYKRSLKGRVWPALVVFLVGFALLIFGIWRGEVTVVLHKAIKICLECIGIG